jgi:putative SOS response-associated peptidase YedK
MCFYYSINKSKTEELKKAGVLTSKMFDSIANRTLVNGFDHPQLPVISNCNVGEIEYYKWGLVPKTITTSEQEKDFSKLYNTLNAKIEGITSSKLYCAPVLHQRCLVLASGFFEWQHIKGVKIPYYISISNNSMFAFAGIWENWVDVNGEKNFTFSILTTAANELMGKIHNTKKRMPLILPYSSCSDWLSTALNPSDIDILANSYSSPELKAHTIRQFSPSVQLNIEDNSLLDYFPYPNKDNDNEASQLSILF